MSALEKTDKWATTKLSRAARARQGGACPLVGLERNRWSVWTEMDGQFAAESVVSLLRNTHLSRLTNLNHQSAYRNCSQIVGHTLDTERNIEPSLGPRFPYRLRGYRSSAGGGPSGQLPEGYFSCPPAWHNAEKHYLHGPAAGQ